MKRFMLAIALVIGLGALPVAACPIHGTAGGQPEENGFNQLFGGVPSSDSFSISYADHEFAVTTHTGDNTITSSYSGTSAVDAMNASITAIEHAYDATGAADGSTYGG